MNTIYAAESIHIQSDEINFVSIKTTHKPFKGRPPPL